MNENFLNTTRLVAVALVLALPAVANADVAEGSVEGADFHDRYFIEVDSTWMQGIELKKSLQWTGRSRDEWHIPASARDQTLQTLYQTDCRLPTMPCDLA